MAKFVYTPLLAENGGFTEYFADMVMDQERLAGATEDDPASAVSYYSYSGAYGRVAFLGENIVPDHEWRLTSGEIHTVRFGTDWEDALKVTGLDLDVIPLDQALVQNDVLALLERLTVGDDKIIGSTVGDYLYGGRGADRIKGGDGRDLIVGGIGADKLTGGAGSDEFFFSNNQGRDVITDFDANGGGRRQDYIQVTGDNPFTIHARGHDTVIEFGHGSVTLLGVDRSDFSRADIHFVEF